MQAAGTRVAVPAHARTPARARTNVLILDVFFLKFPIVPRIYFYFLLLSTVYFTAVVTAVV